MIDRRRASENRILGKCTAPTEVYSRVCGFFRPIQAWNRGKQEEYKDRTPYKVTD